MDRRNFLHTATLAAAASAGGALVAQAADAPASPAPSPSGPGPTLVEFGEPVTKRWVEQRWVLDNIIQANGVDWDQPRSFILNGPCGMEASGDFAAIRAQVKKYADISPAFEAAARHRETRARDAEAAGQKVSARDNYFIAAVLWMAAQWPIHDADEQNLAYNRSKRDCFTSYAKLADHKVEGVSIPFQGKALPAWLHLPPGYQGAAFADGGGGAGNG